MTYQFQLSCESTVDLSYDYISGRDISVIFYTYVVEGKEYVDDMGRNPNALPEFFEMLKQGKMPATSQINTFRYEEYFEELLKKGGAYAEMFEVQAQYYEVEEGGETHE